MGRLFNMDLLYQCNKPEEKIEHFELGILADAILHSSPLLQNIICYWQSGSNK